MKYIYVIILLVFFILGSCKKESEPVNNLDGKAQASLNELEWTTTNIEAYYANDRNSFDIHIIASDDNGLDFFSHSFLDVPLAEDRYSLYLFGSEKPASAKFIPLDGDAILGDYNLLESDSANHITVSNYNRITGEVSGTFQATYIVDSLFVNELIDTVKITNGIFSAKLRD